VKNQYFGDINDYRKYGLLRILAAEELNIGVCWMLTPDDGGTDGASVQYLDESARWRHYDPRLFDYLRQCIKVEGVRSVEHPRLPSLLGNADVHAVLVTDDQDERRRYFDEMLEKFRDIDLVLFDPDNGLEVASVPRGHKNSNKYLYWDEVIAAFQARHSVLVYQHFPREERVNFIARLATEMQTQTGAPQVFWFSTSSVVYFLASQPRHVAHFTRQAQRVADAWQGQFEVGTGGK
jgi:hypothetical protein